VLLAAMILLVLFWNGIAPAMPVAPAAAPTLTSSPPLLLILSNVNYVALTINGNKQADKLHILVAVQRELAVQARRSEVEMFAA
jgi:hypothetical protein